MIAKVNSWKPFPAVMRINSMNVHCRELVTLEAKLLPQVTMNLNSEVAEVAKTKVKSIAARREMFRVLEFICCLCTGQSSGTQRAWLGAVVFDGKQK